MRIDVQHCQHDIDDELDTLYARLHEPGHRLHHLPAIALGGAGLFVRHREADGEFFLYVEDRAARQLAGYMVFNRLPELPRRADRYLRAPHTRLRGSAQRRGLATTLYRWGLDAGLCLISGARQSVGAARLWTALAGDYRHGFVDVEDRALRYLGETVADDVHGALHTRRLLLGNGWTFGELARATGMTGVDEAGCEHAQRPPDGRAAHRPRDAANARHAPRIPVR
ncbi:histone acetyltransferase [Burkholderia sp. AU19243]|uniref:histone acetyltransferase n=1 Tax=Burkholderia sp. AU19243 TaxID=2824810 RepID=UPI001BA299F0|nr:histone acetyltransferase [Burkholderia sp. AU19243]MBR8142611.1 histone acetyltransferase [Burkholderia vietnamiensis]MBR8365183.1 histone acetyltransferase [Burkholderia sp. AU19243]